MAEAPWSVSDLNRYVRQTLETDFRLQEARVTGEISGFKVYASGHWYFTLKDANAQVNCVMWRARAQHQYAQPREGDKVEVVGKITLYETRGQFQLDAAQIIPRGEGALYREFLRLKERLEAEGLFAPERKRPLPAWPRCIGLVTSPQGAALRDLLTIIRRRYPLAEVLLSPTAVQGADAPPQIAQALVALAEFAPEVIIVGRGGGSYEDLACFNDERVARAIAACPAPVVSAVGHETDTTIADFVADVRAPTPSAAAELVTPEAAQLDHQLAQFRARLSEAARAQVRQARQALQVAQAQLKTQSPLAQLNAARQRVDDLHLRLARAMQHRLALHRERLAGARQTLASVSPLRVLQRGYAIVTDAEGHALYRANDTAAGAVLRVRLSEGELTVEVQ